MDETVAYLNCSTTRTLPPTGDKPVAVNIGGATSSRFTLAVSFAMHGTKLPIFVLLKKQRGEKIEKSLYQIFPARTVACVQAKRWMDNYTMDMWYNKVHRPYNSNLN